MKTLGLVLALMVVVGGACVADIAAYDIYAGTQLVAAPLAPFNPDPLSVFANAPDGIDYMLFRYDPSSGWVTYDSFDPEMYGGVMLGEGAMLTATTSATISYEGFPDALKDSAEAAGTDMWISLPGNSMDGVDAGGWHLIGQPFNHETVVDPTYEGTGSNILFTDGTQVLNWAEANAAGWVDSKLTNIDAASGAIDVQFDGWGGDDTLRVGKGYWLNTYKDNLAMIILAN